MALIPDATPCQTGEGVHVGGCGYRALFACVLWAHLLLEEKATCQTTMETAAVQGLLSSYGCLTVSTNSMQEGFQQLNIVF